MSKLIAFGYYGGKYSHLDWLLPLLPTQGIQHYCEPFGGSAAVLLNRLPAPVETYNDLDGDVVNFFKVLRGQKDELLEQIALTPFSREEFESAIAIDPSLSDMERARRFYVRIGQVRSDIPNARKGHWNYCITFSKRGMSGAASAYWGILDRLNLICERLTTVQIEHLPALDVIGRYDHPDTLYYVDPPYTHDTRSEKRGYRHEMDIEQHRDLLTTLRACLGKVALSGYDNPLYTEMLGDWFITRAPLRNIASGDGSERQEVLWTNYDPAAIHSVTDLPLFAHKEGVA